MGQEHETAASFNELQKITQMMRTLKNGAPTNATNQESERTQASEIASQSALTPKATPRAKNHALRPTKRAFSERQKATIRDNSQASTNKSQETEQANQQGNNANAFKSDEAFKQGLATQGGDNEA
ncbi:hypothetical protein VQW74_06410 [Helicobacter pylori]|uniref:hypothetical protein n=1 Tax=Helicobacter pylori TaxID=210 RepID=UPI003567CE2F